MLYLGKQVKWDPNHLGPRPTRTQTNSDPIQLGHRPTRTQFVYRCSPNFLFNRCPIGSASCKHLCWVWAGCRIATASFPANAASRWRHRNQADGHKRHKHRDDDRSSEEGPIPSKSSKRKKGKDWGGGAHSERTRTTELCPQNQVE